MFLVKTNLLIPNLSVEMFGQLEKFQSKSLQQRMQHSLQGLIKILSMLLTTGL
jgi:hypothetical protein